MNHLMIDIETCGTRPNCPVLSIGAVKFNMYTGEIGKTFYAAIDPADAFNYGVPSGDTFKWWMEQSEAARSAAVGGRSKLPEALNSLTSFCSNWSDVEVFGNGPHFDMTILEYAYHRALGREAPWKFWNVRDCRTVAMLAGKRAPKITGGTYHNALDDAIHQAKWVCDFYRSIKGLATGSVVAANAESDVLDL